MRSLSPRPSKSGHRSENWRPLRREGQTAQVALVCPSPPSGHRSFTPAAETGLSNPTPPAETPSKYSLQLWVADPRWEHIGNSGLPTPRRSDARSREGGKPRVPPGGFETSLEYLPGVSRPRTTVSQRHMVPPGCGLDTGHELATAGAALTAPHAHTWTPQCSCAKPILSAGKRSPATGSRQLPRHEGQSAMCGLSPAPLRPATAPRAAAEARGTDLAVALVCPSFSLVTVRCV